MNHWMKQRKNKTIFTVEFPGYCREHKIRFTARGSQIKALRAWGLYDCIGINSDDKNLINLVGANIKLGSDVIIRAYYSNKSIETYVLYDVEIIKGISLKIPPFVSPDEDVRLYLTSYNVHSVIRKMKIFKEI